MGDNSLELASIEMSKPVTKVFRIAEYECTGNDYNDIIAGINAVIANHRETLNGANIIAALKYIKSIYIH